MKIIIVKLHALGDLVITTPAIRRLKEGFPEARFDLLTTNWTAPAALGNPHIDKLISVDNRLFFAPGPGTVVPTVKLIKRIRSNEYDFSVQFHKHGMIDRFIAVCGIKRRFRFADQSDNRSIELNEQRHSAVTAFELADLAVKESGGISQPEPSLSSLTYEWFVSEAEQTRANEIIRKYGLSRDSFIVIFPGGGVNPNNRAEVKRWSSEKYAHLLDRAYNKWKIPVILMGGQGDVPVSREVYNKSRGKRFDFTGRFDLRTVAAIVRSSKLAISNDSGPLHLSAAVGTPVIGIFGPTGASVKLPPGDMNRAVSSPLPCSPCYFGAFKGCIFNQVRCLEEITVDSVLEVVGNSLAGRFDSHPEMV